MLLEVELGNTSLLTDCAQKSPQTLERSSRVFVEMGLGLTLSNLTTQNRIPKRGETV